MSEKTKTNANTSIIPTYKVNTDAHEMSALSKKKISHIVTDNRNFRTYFFLIHILVF